MPWPTSWGSAPPWGRCWGIGTGRRRSSARRGSICAGTERGRTETTRQLTRSRSLTLSRHRPRDVVEVDGLHEVFVEAGLSGALAVGLLAVAGEGDETCPAA